MQIVRAGRPYILREALARAVRSDEVPYAVDAH
jgi:hypothetical protein